MRKINALITTDNEQSLYEFKMPLTGYALVNMVLMVIRKKRIGMIIKHYYPID